MGEESVEDDIGSAFELAAIHSIRNHLGRVRMQIIGRIFTEDQRMAPRAEIRLQILDRLAGVLRASIGAESVSLHIVAQQKSRVRRPAFSLHISNCRA